MFVWGTIWKQNVWLRHIVRDEPRISGCFRSSVMISPLFVSKWCTTPWVVPLNQQAHWGFSCSFLMFVVAFLSSSLLIHSNLSSEPGWSWVMLWWKLQLSPKVYHQMSVPKWGQQSTGPCPCRVVFVIFLPAFKDHVTLRLLASVPLPIVCQLQHHLFRATWCALRSLLRDIVCMLEQMFEIWVQPPAVHVR